MGRNDREMLRLVRTLDAFFTAGVGAAVRFVRRRLVRATPKDTQFAAGWTIGIGGPPDITPLDKPPQAIHPLPGDADTDAEMARSYRLGDDVVLVSPARYIRWLVEPSVVARVAKPQAPATFIEDEIEAARQDLASWRWGGTVATMIMMLFASSAFPQGAGIPIPGTVSVVEQVADAAELAALSCSVTEHKKQQRFQFDTQETYYCYDAGGGFAWNLVGGSGGVAAGDITGLTSGLLTFGGIGLDQDAELVYDPTSDHLSIGTGTTSDTLRVEDSLDTGVLIKGAAGQPGDPFKIQDSGGNTDFVALADGKIGIGTNAPLSILHLEDFAVEQRFTNQVPFTWQIGQYDGSDQFSIGKLGQTIPVFNLTTQGLLLTTFTGSALTLTGSGIRFGIINQNSTLWTIGQDAVVDEFTVSKSGGPFLHIDGSGNVGILTTTPDSRLDIAAGAITGAEMTAPGAPAADGWTLFGEDTGAGKTRVCIRFNSGTAQCFAEEP